jgi:hypothetical protein
MKKLVIKCLASLLLCRILYIFCNFTKGRLFATDFQFNFCENKLLNSVLFRVRRVSQSKSYNKNNNKVILATL